jgi:predicted secreted protein
LPQTLLTRVYAYAEGSDTQPIGAQALSCRVVYDLWEGVYRVQRHTAVRDETFSLNSVPSVMDTCLSAKDLPVSLSAQQNALGGRFYFATLVELNPLSSDTVQRIRRWLARPSGDALRGDAFFGSFVSIFVSRKLGSAEKTLAFRSAPQNVPR